MIQTIIPLILFLFPLAYSPGPGNMFFAANGARFGFAATMPASLGYHIATWIVTCLIGLGFGRFATEFPLALKILKYLGGAYVLYLAWGLFRAGLLKNSAEPRRARFVDGVVLLVLNPKAYVIIMLMFTQFTNADTSSAMIILIATIFTVNNLLAFSIWAFVGDRLAAMFRNESDATRLNLFFGIILATVAIWMLIT